MNKTVAEQMAKASQFRLTGKSVKIDNMNKWVNDTVGTVVHETDKGLWVRDAWSETVFIPWSSIAILKLVD